MSVLENGAAESLSPLLEEGLALVQELSLLERELQRSLLSMDFQRLAAAVEAGTGSLCRGERFIEQKKMLAGEESLCKLIELQPESAERSAQLGTCELLKERISAARAGKEVNRRLFEAGTRIASRMQNVLSACRTTYNFRGKPRSNASGSRSLDQNC